MTEFSTNSLLLPVAFAWTNIFSIRQGGACLSTNNTWSLQRFAYVVQNWLDYWLRSYGLYTESRLRASLFDETSISVESWPKRKIVACCKLGSGWAETCLVWTPALVVDGLASDLRIYPRNIQNGQDSQHMLPSCFVLPTLLYLCLAEERLKLIIVYIILFVIQSMQECLTNESST